jgi:hypothetical protein
MSILNQFQYAIDVTAFMHTAWYYTVLFHFNNYCKHNTDDKIKDLQDVKDKRDRKKLGGKIVSENMQNSYREQISLRGQEELR